MLYKLKLFEKYNIIVRNYFKIDKIEDNLRIQHEIRLVECSYEQKWE